MSKVESISAWFTSDLQRSIRLDHRAEKFSRQPSHRRYLIVNVGCDGLADEQIQSIYEEFVNEPALHVGVAIRDERCLHVLRRQRVQAESDEFVFDIASGKIPASINGVKLILRADVDDEFLAFWIISRLKFLS